MTAPTAPKQSLCYLFPRKAFAELLHRRATEDPQLHPVTVEDLHRE